LAIRGLDASRLWLAVIGGLVGGLGALFRYSGVTIVPLLGLYVWLHRERIRAAVAAWTLAAAAAATVVWAGLSAWTYGRVHALVATGFQTETFSLPGVAHRLGYLLTSLGLVIALPGALVLLAGGLRGRARRLGFGAGAVVGVALWLHQGYSWPSGLSLALGLALGGVTLGTALPAAESEDRATVHDRWFLGAWLGGILAFDLALRFAAVRYLLPALPPAALLSWRCRPDLARMRFRNAAATGLGLALSLGLATADARFADTYRTYAAFASAGPGQLWFTGHWGLQHYLEAAGGRPLGPRDRPSLRPGDEIVVPSYAWPQPLPAGVSLEPVARVCFPAGPGLRTFSVEGRGCFYSDRVAPANTAVWLPFAFSSAPLETVQRWRVRQGGGG
jgi:hypothetical protein